MKKRKKPGRKKKKEKEHERVSGNYGWKWAGPLISGEQNASGDYLLTRVERDIALADMEIKLVVAEL